MRLLRRAAVAALLLAVSLALVLAALDRELAGDGTARILELRGERGGARVLAERLDAGSTVRHLALTGGGGEELASAWVRRPLRLDPEHRILLTYAGAHTGERILELIPPADDLVLVAMQYPFERPHGVAARARAPYDVRRAAFRSVAAGLAAVDWLEGEAGLDPGRILLMGASVGSVFATLHGALDPRIPEVLLVHGGADLPSVLEGAMASRTPRWLLPAAVRLARIPTDAFDPARYVERIAPRRLVVIAARDDRHFPPHAVEAFFARAGEPKVLRWTDTGHVGAGKPDVVAAVLEEVATYLDEAAGAAAAGPRERGL